MVKKKIEAGEAEAPAEVKPGPILVNTDKVIRAKEILALVAGKVPKSESEADLKERFTLHLAEAEVSHKSEGALQFIYEKLGGLVRSAKEQEAHEEVVADMKKSNRKRAIEK